MSTLLPQAPAATPDPLPNPSPRHAPPRAAKTRFSWRSPRTPAGLGTLLVLAVVGTGLAWRWWISARVKAEIITATVVRGDLPITVTERGELDSQKSIEVRCEVEGKE